MSYLIPKPHYYIKFMIIPTRKKNKADLNVCQLLDEGYIFPGNVPMFF